MVANPSYEVLIANPDGYESFAAFYPYYLGEHSNKICRRLHLAGTSISVLVLFRVVLSKLLRDPRFRLAKPAWKYLSLGIIQGYFFAWIGHFFFERNRPATLKYPLYSFLGDLRMLLEVLTLKRSA